MGYNVPHYIGGQLINETDTEAQAIYNPALGEIIGQVHFASKATCDRAVAIAKAAGNEWSQTPAIKEREFYSDLESCWKNTKWIWHE